jgi:hypothetical protein
LKSALGSARQSGKTVNTLIAPTKITFRALGHAPGREKAVAKAQASGPKAA